MIAAVAAALLALAGQDGPSFDCARATEPAERAICESPDLSALDARLADRYAAVRRDLWPAARDALVDDQRWFLGARDAWFENREAWSDFPDLEGRMSDRIEALGLIEARRDDDLAGLWRNLAGQVRIRPAADGRYNVSISAVDPVAARWICDVTFERQADGATLTAAEGTDETVRLSTSVRDGVLTVTETRIDGAGIGPGFCGHNGSVAGRYLRGR